MILDPPPRLGEEAVEWMDAGVGTPAEIAHAYDQLEIVNRRLAGFRATFDGLERVLPPVGEGSAPPRLSILEVAGGSGDFAARLADWSRSRGYTPSVFLLDLNPLALSHARRLGERAPIPVRADALRIPFPDRAFDLVHCATFFHHLSTVRARDLLDAMCRTSRRIVVVNDLVRSRVAAAAIRLLSLHFSENRLIRHDGPLSVRKAFTPAELEAVARAAGCDGFRWRLTRAFPYRMALVGWRLDPGAAP